MDSNKLHEDKQHSSVDGFGDVDFLAETEGIVTDEPNKGKSITLYKNGNRSHCCSYSWIVSEIVV